MCFGSRSLRSFSSLSSSPSSLPPSSPPRPFLLSSLRVAGEREMGGVLLLFSSYSLLFSVHFSLLARQCCYKCHTVIRPLSFFLLRQRRLQWWQVWDSILLPSEVLVPSNYLFLLSNTFSNQKEFHIPVSSFYPFIDDVISNNSSSFPLSCWPSIPFRFSLMKQNAHLLHNIFAKSSSFLHFLSRWG